MRALETTLANGDVARLSGALRPAATSLAATVPPLADVLGRLRPVSRCLQRVVAPALLTPIDDGPLSAGVAPYRELLSAGVGLASAGQAFDGLGQTIRYNLGVGNQLITLDQGTPAEAQTRAERPLLGSRPAPPARRPPLRDDVACETQAPQPLAADPIPFRAAQRRAPIDRYAARRAAVRIARSIEGAGR
ncbi:Long-chain-fatty-acid--CoA ligase [Patulibacter medicamentivorans]|uniref:Long-chain-fatty-acid--CoA ligase n=1 Tax=Patulibacter medicamentivorans TaxID=1097667 RepID=H0E9N6_9ACTN|nr:Long-chain-fatty-acid--CoA ligase [Patulibacter medicamentivorans]